MRILHLADLHLGKALYDAHLTEDQAHLLDQVVDLARDQRVDVVAVAGDVYDRSVPPVEATLLLDDLLSRLVLQLKVKVLVIPGNHDSADRLAFGRRLLDQRGLFIATAPERGIAPVVLGDAHGAVVFHPVPYCEPVLLRRTLDDPEITDFESAHRHLLASAPAPAGRSVCIAHCFTRAGKPSESERELSIGGSCQVDAAIFSGYSLLLLGHLHRPQAAGRNGWYAGTPMPYAFEELDHEKSVAVHELAADGSVRRELFTLTPRRVLRRISGSFDEILERARTDRSKGDYVWITLTDRGTAYEHSRRLREEYPNALHISRDTGMGDTVRLGAGPELQRRTPREIVDDFFEEMTGGKLGPGEAQEIDAVLRAAMRENADGGRP